MLRENSAAVRLISHASLTVINCSKDMSLSIYNMQAAMHCWVLFICWQVAGQLHTDSYANDSNIKHSSHPPFTLPSINTLHVGAVWWEKCVNPCRKGKIQLWQEYESAHCTLCLSKQCVFGELDVSKWSRTCNFILIHKVRWKCINVWVGIRVRTPSWIRISHEVRFKLLWTVLSVFNNFNTTVRLNSRFYGSLLWLRRKNI